MGIKYKYHSHLFMLSGICVSLASYLFFASIHAACAETVKWGPYTVVAQQSSHSAGVDRDWKVKIISSAGEVLREIHGFNFAHITKLSFGAQCNPILMFELGDGGNDGLNVIYAYSYSTSTGIKNLLATYGDLSDFSFKNLGHHNLPELIVDDAALNQFDHFSRWGLRTVTRVYEWNGDCYQEKTPKYAQVTKGNISDLRSKFLHSLPDAERYVRGPFVDGDHDSYSSSHEDVMAPTVNYWANAIVTGKKADAEQLFRQKTTPRLQGWLKSKYSLILQALSAGHQNIRTDDSKLVGT